MLTSAPVVHEGEYGSTGWYTMFFAPIAPERSYHIRDALGFYTDSDSVMKYLYSPLPRVYRPHLSHWVPAAILALPVLAILVALVIDTDAEF